MSKPTIFLRLKIYATMILCVCAGTYGSMAMAAAIVSKGDTGFVANAALGFSLLALFQSAFRALVHKAYGHAQG